MTSYLRNDMWAKTCISFGEHRATSASALTRLRARFDFGRAVVVGVVSTAVYLVAIVILLVPHLVSSLNTYYLDLVALRKVRQLFYLSTGRFKAAIMISAVALISIFKIDFSSFAQTALLERLDKQWKEYQENLKPRFHQRMMEIQKKRLDAAESDEIYRPYGGEAYYSLLVKDLDKRVGKYCDAFGKDQGSVDGKYERYVHALEEIDLYVNRACRDLDELPVTYREAAVWRMKEAVKLQRQALTFLDEQAGHPVSHQQALYPKKFDSRKYYQKVSAYRTQIKGQLDQRVQEVQRQQDTLLTLWDPHMNQLKSARRALQKSVDRLTQRKKQLRWWVGTLAFMPQSLVDSLESWAIAVGNQRTQTQQQLNNVNRERVLRVNSIANGVFLTLNSQFFNMEHTFNRLVSAKGAILKTLDAFARPAWSARMWRCVSPAFSCIPNWKASLENWLDPDV